MAKTTQEYQADYEPIIYGLSTQLEALARVLTQVRTVEDPDQDPPITPEEFVSIMQVFHEKLYALKDISGSLDGVVEEASGPPPTVHAV
jgi:hypothetical protein